MKTKHDYFFKRYISFLLAAFLFVYSSMAYLPVNGEEEIYSKVLRLHILANSDSDTDQAMKLFVRDSILKELGKMYEENKISDIEEAKAFVGANTERLSLCAQNAVNKYNPDCGYTVELEIGEEYYPTKEYESVTLPAGKYSSLIVKIGKAEGHNWWCVLFPTLCLATATRKDSLADSYVYKENGEKFIEAGFTPHELRIITESDKAEVKIKFRTLEILGELFGAEE